MTVLLIVVGVCYWLALGEYGRRIANDAYRRANPTFKNHLLSGWYRLIIVFGLALYIAVVTRYPKY